MPQSWVFELIPAYPYLIATQVMKKLESNSPASRTGTATESAMDAKDGKIMFVEIVPIAASSARTMRARRRVRASYARLVEFRMSVDTLSL